MKAASSLVQIRGLLFSIVTGIAILSLAPISHALTRVTRLHPEVVPVFVENQFQCSASILGDNAVLTANHCFNEIFQRERGKVKYKNFFWLLETSRVSVEVNGIRFNTKQVFVHYNGPVQTDQSSPNDLAILVFEGQPFAKMPHMTITNYKLRDEDRVELLGYGYSNPLHTEGAGQRKIGKNIYCEKDRFEMFEAIRFRQTGYIYLSDRTDCNKDLPQYSATTRPGDSGGPVILENTQIIIAVVNKGVFLQSFHLYTELALENNLHFIFDTIDEGAHIALSKDLAVKQWLNSKMSKLGSTFDRLSLPIERRFKLRAP